MSLTPGTRLGPYEIVAALGAGGMGEVFRARDTRLDRTVAIKVLPAHLSTDATLRDRFEREAKVISQLTHPHICTLYDVGRHGAIDFLVMEYLEGETVADRIARGLIPIPDVVRIATEIADALDRAHRHGVVHRDLKPANVFLVKGPRSGPPTAKLLDFGLARTAPVSSSTPGATALPTSPAPLTQHGAVMGTFQYMSPEQLEGKDADARSDLFAFGALVYEMVTRQRAFAAASQAGLFAAILERDPPSATALMPEIPVSLDRVIRTCLAKDPDERFQTAHDLLLQLRWIDAGSPSQASAAAAPTGASLASTPARAPSGRLAFVGVIGLALGAAMAALGMWLTRAAEPPERAPTRFTIAPPLDVGLPVLGNQGVLAVSRDGRVIASVVEPRRQIFVRSLDRSDGRVLDGTDNASWPFFSPDGKSIGFFVGSQLRRVSVDGGAPTNIGSVGLAAAVWADDDTIVVGQNSGGLVRIPAGGGVTQPIIELEPGELSHRMPEIVPGTDVVLYNSMVGNVPRVMALRLGTLQRQLVLERGARPQYSSSGHLLFGEGNQIMAVAFDVSALTVRAAPVRVVEGVSFAGPANPLYAGAAAGTLIYLPVGASTKRSLTWVDRQGRTVGTVAIAPRHFEQPRISPDGSRVLVATREPGAQDVLLVDLSRGVATRFSSSPAEDETPVWSAAGTHVFFKSAPELRQKPSDGSGAEGPLDGPQFELQERFNRNAHLSSASPDGKYLALNAVSGVTGEDAEIIPLGTGGTLVKLAASQANEVAPRFSPDGRWVAYQSDESGQPEIYVQAFPGAGGKWQVSKAGGTEPVWARSGTELFYRAGRAFMSVPVGTSPTFRPGSPMQLFEGSFETGHRFHPNYDVAPDGKRFLMITRDGQQPGVSVHVEIDLHGELRRLAPPPR